MNSTQLGLVSSIFTLGGLLGALGAGPVAARYGRLVTMRLTTTFFVLGSAGEALAPNIGAMAAGRFISGLGAGAAVVVVPIYISEIAPPHQKGFFGAFTQIMTNMGIFVTQLLGYFLSHGQMWRIILAVAGVIGLIQLAGLTLAIDSPKWEADQGKTVQAKNDLRRIRGHGVDIQREVEGWGFESERDLEGMHSPYQLDTITAMLTVNRGRGSTPNRRRPHITSWRKLEERQNEEGCSFHLGSSLESRVQSSYCCCYCSHACPAAMWYACAPTDPCPSLLLGWLRTKFFPLRQCHTGINSIVMYGVSLLADLLKSNSALLNILVSVLNIVVTLGCAPLADILGRKFCILGSIAGMGASSVLLAIGIRQAIPVLSAIAVLFFVASFGFGLGPVPFILSSELVGPEAVGATQSWALAANWIATFIVAQFFPMVNEKLGKGMVYFLFAGLAAFFFVFIAWWVPETKGKKDADEVWGRESRRVD